MNKEQQAMETLKKAEQEKVRQCSEEIYNALIKHNCKMVPRFIMTGTRPEHFVLIVPRQPEEQLPAMITPESL